MLAELLCELAGTGTTTLLSTHDLDFPDAIGARRVELCRGRLDGARP